jgi:hypothetical protein
MGIPIFIASSICYEPIHLQRLIQNITTSSDIPPSNVYIISGGHATETTEKVGNITVYRVSYRCFEFTPFIFLIKNPEFLDFEYAFFTHDTVSFGPTFYARLLERVERMRVSGYTTAKIDNGMSMNIGVYTKNIIIKNKDLLQSVCMYTNDTTSLWDMKHKLIPVEDKILKSGRLNPIAYIPTIEKYTTTDTEGKPINVYKKIYNEIDFIKFQMNYCKIYSITTPIDIR